MNAWTQFVIRVNRVLQEAFAEPGTEPDKVATHLLKRLPFHTNRIQDRTAIQRFLEERGVRLVVHFTPIENVQSILRYGLIPRAHLELKAVQLVVRPKFTDTRRLDWNPQMNCLSITFPNYKMFYTKRREQGGRWAVIVFDPSILCDFVCEFTPTNAARAGVPHATGLADLKRLFSDAELRRRLRLVPAETTDPQAEVIEDTVIPPERMLGIAVDSELNRRYLGDVNVKVAVMPKLFGPRHDYSAWRGDVIFRGKDDFDQVGNLECGVAVDQR